MHQIDDKRLEECRKFLTHPTPIRTREELLEIVRDLLWAVEELQLRRLQERTPVETGEDNRLHYLFGSDEAVVKFVDEHKIPIDGWAVATAENLLNVIPQMVRARKLDGADEKLWKEWEEVCRTYESPVGGSA